MSDRETPNVEAAAYLAREDPNAGADVERPTPDELVEDERQLRREQERRWPRCQRCGDVAQPGKWCAATRCPWQRVDGTIVGHEVGG